MPNTPAHQQPDQYGFPPVDDDLLRTMPPVLRAVIKALGFGRAYEFLSLHGGINQNIPKHQSTALGLANDELARLRMTLEPHMDANGRVWMPKPDKLFILTRNAQIRREAASHSITEQTRTYKLSNRQIMNIRADLTKDERMGEQAFARRALQLNPAELRALKALAEEKVAADHSNVIYLRILGKLNKAAVQPKEQSGLVQFDLF